MLGREVPGDFQRGAGELGLPAKLEVGLGQDVQSLFRRDAREVSDRETIAAEAKAGIVVLQADAERHDVHLVRRECPGSGT